MISIPCAVANEYFRRQISFFQYQHLKVYGDDAKNKAIIPIVKRNNKQEPIQDDVDWNLKLPYKMVDSILDMYDLQRDIYIPTNVFTAAREIIQDLPDDEVVEIIDADLVHLKKYDGYIPKFDEVVADAIYNDWHMHITKPTSANSGIIKKYLKHDDYNYMNGGFNVIARVKTLKKIINEIIETSIEIGTEQNGNNHSWWQAMYGLNIACHNNKIKMVDTHNCYYPNVNNLESWHHIAHYSCDPIFDKRNMGQIDVSKFPDNEFYKAAKEWLETYNF
jgi:hypothetical protein